MENAYFYSSVDETKQNRRVLNYLKSYAEQQSQQVYVINSALGANYKYDYSDALVILIPKKKIVIVNYGNEVANYEIDVKEYSNISVKFKDYYQKFDEKNNKDKELNIEIDKKINDLYDEYGKNLEKELEKNNQVKLSKDRDMIILDLEFDAQKNGNVKLYDAKVKVLILEK